MKNKVLLIALVVLAFTLLGCSELTGPNPRVLSIDATAQANELKVATTREAASARTEAETQKIEAQATLVLANAGAHATVVAADTRAELQLAEVREWQAGQQYQRWTETLVMLFAFLLGAAAVLYFVLRESPRRR